MVMGHQIVNSFVTSGFQLGDSLTKAISKKSFSVLCGKLGMIDIYAHPEEYWCRINIFVIVNFLKNHLSDRISSCLKVFVEETWMKCKKYS